MSKREKKARNREKIIDFIFDFNQKKKNANPSDKHKSHN